MLVFELKLLEAKLRAVFNRLLMLRYLSKSMKQLAQQLGICLIKLLGYQLLNSGSIDRSSLSAVYRCQPRQFLLNNFKATFILTIKSVY